MLKKARPRQVEKDILEVKPAGSIFQAYCTGREGQTYLWKRPDLCTDKSNLQVKKATPMGKKARPRQVEKFSLEGRGGQTCR